MTVGVSLLEFQAVTGRSQLASGWPLFGDKLQRRNDIAWGAGQTIAGVSRRILISFNQCELQLEFTAVFFEEIFARAAFGIYFLLAGDGKIEGR